MSANNPKKGSESLENPEEEFSRCLLSQYRFCVAGVGLGTAYAVHAKSQSKGYGLFPMVVGGIAGSAADLLYGYTVACAAEKERYMKSREEAAS